MRVSFPARGASVDNVAFAGSPDAYERGLAGTASGAMLFDFSDDLDTPHRMWMVGMARPLDLLFIDARGVVVETAHGVPGSRAPLGSRPCAMVLETDAGFLVESGVAPGDLAVVSGGDSGMARQIGSSTDYIAQAAGLPGASGAWAQVQSTLQGEGQGADQVGYAALSFVNAYQQFPLVNPSGQVGDAVSAALQFTLSNHSVAAAAGQVEGLVAAIASGAPSAQVFQAFTGTLTATTSLAVAAGSVSFGVGAAIVAGIEIIATIVGLNQAQPPVASVGSCQIQASRPPTIVNGWTWSWGDPTTAGPANTASWRTFPAPGDPNAAEWFKPFVAASMPGYRQENFNWTFGGSGHTDTVYTCFAYPSEVGKRPIDQISNEPQGPPAEGTAGPNVYHHLEVESAFALVRTITSPNDTMARFSLAFFGAWKANREYGLNGLQQRTDADVLAHLVQKWNLANTGPAVTIAPSSEMPLQWNSPTPAVVTPYAAIILGSAGGEVSGTNAQGALVINGYTPSKTVGIVAAGASAGKAVAAVAGVGAAAAVGAAAYGYFAQGSMGYLFGKLVDSAGSAVAGLGAGERHRKKKKRRR